MEDNAIRSKITYLSKKPTICPVCETKFFQEILQIGGGRLIADVVTDTLHRRYRPSQKYGRIDPLIYSLIICPNCFYSSLQNDFEDVQEDKKSELLELRDQRIKFANDMVGEAVDFTKFRTLISGAAGYALACMCYEFFSRKSLPVIKQAICSIRAAYLFEDLEKEKPNEYFKFISELFYKKALFFYKKAIVLNHSKVQVMESLKTYGPDLDKNYGYDGVIYLIGVLTCVYGNKSKIEYRKQDLIEARTFLSKLFGFGKSDFDKPKEIVEKSKDFYELIAKELKDIDGTE